MLMASSFPASVRSRFLNMHFWSYQTNKKVTGGKIFKMVKYYLEYVATIIFWQPRYVLYNSSFYPMPFWKDFLFCATGIILGRRVVFHDLGQYVRELHDGLLPWRRALLKWLLRHAAGSIVMGESVRQTYLGLMDDRRIFVVPGVVEDTMALDVEANRPGQGLLNVLYFSHMSRAKGIFVAFEAAAGILRDRLDVMVTFAGPIENEEVAQRLEELQRMYLGRVRYLGYVEDVRERTAIFRGADVFMFTTLRDVFGLVLLHAMAESLPIVASREGTIPEILPDERHGLLFTKGDSAALSAGILALLGDEGRRRSMGAANRRRFENIYRQELYGDYMTAAFRKLEGLCINPAVNAG